MSDAPNCRFMCHLVKAGVSVLRVIGLKIKYVVLRLKGCHYELVLGNIWSIEFKAANTIFHVCVPSEAIRFQVENFDISIIVARHNNSLSVIIRISETNGPAIRRNLPLHRLQTQHWILLTRVPDSYCPIPTTSYEFWGASTYI